MTVNKIMKMIMVSLTTLLFLTTFSIMGSCRAEEPEGEVVEEGTAGQDDMQEAADDAEDMDMDGDEKENIEEGAVEDDGEDTAAGYMDISAEEAKQLIEDNPDLIIIDVSPIYEDGHIPGAVNYYVGDGSLDTAIPELDPEGKYLVYCHTDSASIAGAQKLVDAGFSNVYRLEGNLSAWVDAGYELEEGGQMTEMKIESPAFENEGEIPAKYTCDGDNINPGLTFEGVPSDADSLVLMVDDPDAPGGTWVHWTVWNIDPSTASMGENSVPAGAVEGNTDFGQPGYGGPCPPSGTHRYFFKLFALDTVLDLDVSSEASDIEAAMEDHILASAELIGLYSR